MYVYTYTWYTKLTLADGTSWVRNYEANRNALSICPQDLQETIHFLRGISQCVRNKSNGLIGCIYTLHVCICVYIYIL